MKPISTELKQIIEAYVEKISAISEDDFSHKADLRKWSKKEVLGHLIDSAQNNLRRFIVGQYESSPSKITYQQDFWVAANNYQHTNSRDLITLWKLINFRICEVLENMPEENYNKVSDSGSIHTLQWLAEDYVRHLKHHLNQIIAGSFDIIYK